MQDHENALNQYVNELRRRYSFSTILQLKHNVNRHITVVHRVSGLVVVVLIFMSIYLLLYSPTYLLT